MIIKPIEMKTWPDESNAINWLVILANKMNEIIEHLNRVHDNGNFHMNIDPICVSMETVGGVNIDPVLMKEKK